MNPSNRIAFFPAFRCEIKTLVSNQFEYQDKLIKFDLRLLISRKCIPNKSQQYHLRIFGPKTGHKFEINEVT